MILRRGDTPPPLPLPSDEQKRTELAAWVLFTTRPTDRALHGWCPAGEASFEVEALTIAAAREAG